MSRPRLLVVSSRFLFPLDQGGKIRTANILRRMKGGAFEVILASPAPRNAADFKTDVATVCDRFLAWPEHVPHALEKAARLFDPLPVAVATDRSPQGQAVIAKLLAEAPDVVLVDFPHAAVLMPERIGCPSVIFTHNVEAE